MQELKRITVPFKYSKKIENLYQDNEKSNLIISCSNNKKNYYDTTCYTKWNDMFLASLSWRNSTKSKGDYFIINPISKLPAWSDVKLKFNDMNLNSELILACKNIGVVKPTNIQSLTIPTIIAGNNVIIGGETGGGKTLAFVLPILNRLFGKTLQEEPIASPSSIIIAPTWELCDQLNKVITQLFDNREFKSIIYKQPEDLHGKVSVLVSTPHNVSSAIDSGIIQLKNLSNVVMDEADMLLDNSFSHIIQRLLSKVSIQTCRPINGEPVGSQLILCNATSPEHLGETFGQFVPMDSFSVIEAADMQRLIPSVSHKFIRCNKEDKPAQLIGTLKHKGVNSCPPTIVFCNTNDNVTSLSSILTENGVDHAILYKYLSMEERRRNFERFQSGDVRVLLSTDLGSRGLDTVKARHIVNYEFPRFISDYLHRAGRTGRVGCASGKVTSFISARLEVSAVQSIERSVRTNQKLRGLDSAEHPPHTVRDQ